jgi:hypothetical protein
MDQLGDGVFGLHAIQENFIGIYENAISKDKCDEIINCMEMHMASNPTEIRNGSGQFDKKDIGRKDYQIFAHKLGNNSILKDIGHALDVCINAYADIFFTLRNLSHIRSEEIKLQKTPPKGGYHVWHCETESRDTGDRVLVWTIYLNDIPDGEGETEFLWQGVRVKPKAGTLCLFPASFTHVHRGNPVYSCDKYIATGWFTFNA